MKKDVLKELYQLSPIPIYEVNMMDWAKRYPSRFDYLLDGSYDGVCVKMQVDYSPKELPERFILIKKSCPNYRKAAIFMHELGHVGQPARMRHELIKQARDEVNAEIFAMKELLNRNLIISARDRLGVVMGWASSLDKDSKYTVAGKILINNSKYRKMVKTLLKIRNSAVTLKEIDRRIKNNRKLLSKCQ